MKLLEVIIMNFWLPQYAHMRPGATGITTTPVNPNNSGKTSVAEAMLTFLQRPVKRLSINDFSLGYRDTLEKFEQHVPVSPTAVASTGGKVAAAAPPPLSDSPVLSLRLKFGYDDTGPDLATAGELLMDLGDASTSVMAEIHFTPVNPE